MNEMYKICFVTTVSLTLRTFVIDLARFLQQTGKFEIHFICDPDEMFAKSLPDAFQYHPVSMKRGISFDGIKAIWQMHRIFKRERFDLVQYSTPNASCYASIAARLAKLPVRLYCQWGIAYVGFRGFKRALLKVIERLVCRNSTWIEPDSFGNLSFSQKEKLYQANKASVVMNGSASGVDLEKFDITQKEQWRAEIRAQHSIPENAVVFVFVGRITRDKGINELFEAAKMLLKQHSDIYLLMVGEVEHSELLNVELFRWSQAEKRVVYCGFSREVEKHLAASDVFVLPSYREGFGSVVIEAEAMGLPVIVTAIPGLSDSVKQDVTGLAVTKADYASLYAAMEQIYRRKKQREAMGKAAFDFASAQFERRRLFREIYLDRLRLINQTKERKKRTGR